VSGLGDTACLHSEHDRNHVGNYPPTPTLLHWTKGQCSSSLFFGVTKGAVGRLSTAGLDDRLPNVPRAEHLLEGGRAIGYSSRAETDRFERFSLTIGGPLYRLYQRSRLLDPPIERVERRLMAVILITWLPLLLLSLSDGKAFDGARIPFVLDLNIQTRFLIALPMLIAAEPLVHRWMRDIVRQFVDRGIVVRGELSRFDAIIDSTIRMRNSVAVEVALFVISSLVSFSIRRDQWATRPGMWYLELASDGRSHLTAAGWWYSLVSLNVFRFVILRWYYRLIIWISFLWRTSRLALRLNALHPDHAGGLGFLARSLTALAPVFVAQTITIAGEIGGRVFQDDMKIDRFVPDIVGFPIFFTLLATAPLAFFSSALIRTGFHGSLEYGELASRYVDQFRQTWLGSRKTASEPLLGSADIQSLADLSNSFEVVRGIQVLPVGFRSLLALVFATALPFLPLALSVLPLTELIRRVIERAI